MLPNCRCSRALRSRCPMRPARTSCSPITSGLGYPKRLRPRVREMVALADALPDANAEHVARSETIDASGNRV